MAVPIVMPKLGMVMSEGVVARWTKPKGEAVVKGEVVAEIETEKISYELEATADGIVHPLVEEGTTLPVDGLMGYLLAEGEAVPDTRSPTPKPARAKTSSAAKPAAASTRAPGKPVPSTPGARKLAGKMGVELAKVEPSGPGGRVTEADVTAFAERDEAPAKAPLPPGMPEPSESVALTRMRKTIGDHMRSSLASSAQLSFLLEVDVTEAQRMRREFSGERDARLTLADVLMKACARALQRVPALNSRLVDGVIHRFEAINIGIAVALDDGLVVPVVHNVEALDIVELSAATRDIVDRARSRRLRAGEFAGGTFTISVLGIVDGFTPILNAGQTAILGVGRSVSKPAVKDGEVVVREMSTLSLTVDHQVVDGASAAGFMRRLQQAIERPKALFE